MKEKVMVSKLIANLIKDKLELSELVNQKNSIIQDLMNKLSEYEKGGFYSGK